MFHFLISFGTKTIDYFSDDKQPNFVIFCSWKDFFQALLFAVILPSILLSK
jgi:hypothetical protein